MGFCEHCEGQRFDRSRVLRALRRLRNEVRDGGRRLTPEQAVERALQAVRALDVPHLDLIEEDDVVH
jgi:hypothetical protein